MKMVFTTSPTGGDHAHLRLPPRLSAGNQLAQGHDLPLHEHGLGGGTSQFYISLFSQCWSKDDNLVEQLTSASDPGFGIWDFDADFGNWDFTGYYPTSIGKHCVNIKDFEISTAYLCGTQVCLPIGKKHFRKLVVKNTNTFNDFEGQSVKSQIHKHCLPMRKSFRAVLTYRGSYLWRFLAMEVG